MVIKKKVFSDNAEFLKDKNIGFLVNCQKDLEFLGKSKNIQMKFVKILKNMKY